MKKILVVEDEPDIQELLGAYLRDTGYDVEIVGDGVAALDRFQKGTFDLILLDLMLPKIDGFGVCELIRRESDVPILMLTALDGEESQLRGFGMDIDDYVTKPFNPQELAARVRSQLRRYTLLGDVHAEERQGLIVNGRLTYDPDRRELRADGEAVKLTATETKIVDLLMRNPGRIFPAEEIYRRVWDGEAAYACENTVMVHIRRIREKIELNPKEPDYIKVVWGIGYKMEQHGT